MKAFLSISVLIAFIAISSIIFAAPNETPVGKVIKISDLTTDIHDPEVQALAAKATQMLDQIAQNCSDLHLKFDGPLVFKLVNAYDDEKMANSIGVPESIRDDWKSITLQADECSFKFLKSNQQLLRYSNWKGNQKKTTGWKKWNKEEAIKMATPFLKVFAEPFIVRLGEPKASYDKNVGGGQWCVTWPRIDSQGHPLDQDQVAIWLPGGGSPSDVEVDMNTPFAEKTGKTISKDDALKAALGWSGIKGKWKPASSTDKLIDNKLLGGDLTVVLPQKNADVALGSPEDASGELAWVFWFEPIHTEKDKLGWDDSFAVFVDAYTGKVIGSDGLL